MKVVVKKVGQEPEVKEIDGLHEMQEIVGGYIEAFLITNDPIVCVCNEEGKLMNLPANFICNGDVIVGDVFFCGTDEEDFISLTDEQIEFIMNVLHIFEI